MLIWQVISDARTNLGILTSSRLEVPGGWLVRTILARVDAELCMTQSFVPDPNHEWKIEES